MPTPRTLADLSEVAPTMHDWYVPAEGGGYRLDPTLEPHVERYDADAVAREAAHAEEVAELRARTARLEGELHDRLIRREVSAALERAGVRAAHVPAVTALLRGHMAFAVEQEGGDFRVTVDDAFGEVGVEFAVNTWLATEEADAYRPASKAVDGPLVARLRELRARMQ